MMRNWRLQIVFWQPMRNCRTFYQAANLAFLLLRFVPLGKRRRQFFAIAAHLFHAFVQVFEARTNDFAHFKTGVYAGGFLFDEVGNLGKRKSQNLSAFDELQSFQRLLAVEPVAASRACRVIEQTLLLVKTQRLYANPTTL